VGAHRGRTRHAQVGEHVRWHRGGHGSGGSSGQGQGHAQERWHEGRGSWLMVGAAGQGWGGHG